MTGVFVRSSVFLAVLAAASALGVAVGCSAPYKAKEGLPVCEDGDPECNGDTNRETARRGSSTSTSSTSGAPTTPGETEPAATTPTSSTDAGAKVDAAPPPVQPSCAKLATCCDEIKAAGYQDTNCRGVVADNNNQSCYATHVLYKNAGDCTGP
jgi:hypothetical protein